MTAEELLQRYIAGGRNFSGIVISELREGLFRGINLSDINLEGSSIDIDFSGAILRRANLRYSVWHFWKWENVDLSGSDMTGINNICTCIFVRCNFSNTIWDQADLFQSTFKDCDLLGANFDNTKFSEVDLYG